MRKVIVVVPWLEGGGAQAALQGILSRLGDERVELIVLFEGSRNHSGILGMVSKSTSMDFPRSALGALRASMKLPGLLQGADKVYSLMRASHVVMGLMGSHRTLRGRLVATMHQLPSSERGSFRGRAEEVLLRRTLRAAALVTAPSERAINELRDLRLACPESLKFEPNLLVEAPTSLVPPRPRLSAPIRLVFAGRLTEQKGLDDLLRSLSDSVVPVTLRILGDGDERANLEMIAGMTGSKVNVTFEGRVTDVGRHLDWADFAIMPSRSELNPMFVWEAWARGRGVISSSILPFLDLSAQGPIKVFESMETIQNFLGVTAQLDEFRSEAFAAGPRSAQHQNQESSIVKFLTL